MSDAPLLNELCSIWLTIHTSNINKFKYRCPGCDARTCSLPCYKRHQQWAQCSGKRDPTKFVKKSQLVTPAGIDHDYNFLSGIERNLEKAEKVAGATTATAPSDGLSNRQRAGVPYGKLEAAASVKIIRAPQGLSRQKENKSHMSATKKASRNIVWTVEWIDETRRRVLTETSSVHQIKDAQPFVQHDTDGKSKRRKLNANPPAATTDDPTHLQQQDVAPTPENQNQSFPVDDAQSERSTPRREATPRWEKEPTTKRQADVADVHPIDTRHDEPSAQSLGDGHHRFFLLKPRTSTTRHVLIPLEPSYTLAENLRGHTILEFPTIHVFPAEMEKLPEEEFMLEEEYMKLEGEQQKEFDELMEELDPEILKRLKEGENGASRNSDGGGEEEVDSKKILDVLKQDLGGRL
ncbi:HIT finger domain containing protein [Stemphylium lycopersici]|nr:hit finger domain-containing protein [Stemphylium lycopersici]RAR07096.1 HIT finger domain containing protein [Stemphylium lycopersici]